ncbi:hypothetical protein FOZ63_029752, partial [Perkinsus olseni]
MIHTLVIIAASLSSFFVDAYGNGCLATCSRQKYWRDGDRSLIGFFKTDEGKQSKCEGQLPDRNELLQFVKDLREQIEDNATICFTYIGGALPSTGTDAAWAGHFVALVELHLLFALAPEYGPLGIGFDAVRHFAAYYPDIHFKVDVRLDHSLDDRQVVDEIMRKADHVSVTTFASHRLGLVGMDYKAKVTFVATGDCTAPCGTTMCDDYAFVVPSNIVTAPIQYWLLSISHAV